MKGCVDFFFFFFVAVLCLLLLVLIVCYYCYYYYYFCVCAFVCGFLRIFILGFFYLFMCADS